MASVTISLFSSRVRFLRAVVVAIIVAVAATACSAQPPTVPIRPSSSPTANGDSFNSVKGASEEYVQATKKYELPPGYVYPASPFSEGSGDYQAGYGTQEAVIFWNCSWGKQYLQDEAKNAPEAAADLDRYASVEDTETYKKYWDPQSVQSYIVASIASAKLGDPSAIERNVSINCH